MKKQKISFYGLLHPGSGTALLRKLSALAQVPSWRNIVTIITLHLFVLGRMAVVVVRSILGPILGGSPTGILYSLTGGVLAA